MPHSHHSHSGQFCRHAKDNLEDVVLEAIRQGFEVYGLSEHAPRYRVEDLFPEEADLTPSDLLQTYLEFLSTASSLKRKYASQISLLISLETDYITHLDLLHTTKLLSDHPEIDYIVGSVHHVNGISIDFSRSTFLRAVQACVQGKEGRTMDPGPPPSLDLGDTTNRELQDGYMPIQEEMVVFLDRYFDQQYKMIDQFEPEVIGHFDLCFLWTPAFSTSIKSIDKLWEKVERNIKRVISYGGLFEANSASLRKGWETSYPSKQILNLIISLGGKICLSDDSHGVSYVGLNYTRMRDYLLSQGVTEVWYLVSSAKDKQEYDEDIRNDRRRVFARKMPDWEKHAFWADK
ncbi:uncharacterized protein I303_101107 [Kwoniella dejecticola CBS 10117]|uniref:Histidinol-phosphatase n=1 Tax=Kwoniella dejecticola CBS 10117 TaxID=1296121 RepID=A0A1A6AGU5_9TREE|nr:histidinol-phosphatase (PHP family) [Kwoniella dejecticola CBS 10117]OBR89286.1 histidinol-phosphatase (PHP family) [Kwoniella dejecticola CBS 10117]